MYLLYLLLKEVDTYSVIATWRNDETKITVRTYRMNGMMMIDD